MKATLQNMLIGFVLLCAGATLNACTEDIPDFIFVPDNVPEKIEANTNDKQTEVTEEPVNVEQPGDNSEQPVEPDPQEEVGDVPDEPTEPEEPISTPITYTLTVNGGKGADTRVLAYQTGYGLTSKWEVGDKVLVFNSSEEQIGILTAQTAGETTTFAGTLNSNISEDKVPKKGDTLVLHYLAPEYDGQLGTLEYISANCDFSIATVVVDNINDTEITTTYADFINQQVIFKLSLTDVTDDSELQATVLTISDGALTYTVNPDPAASMLYVAFPSFSNKTLTIIATIGSSTYMYERPNTSVTMGKLYNVGVKMTLVTYSRTTYGPATNL